MVQTTQQRQSVKQLFKTPNAHSPLTSGLDSRSGGSDKSSGLEADDEYTMRKKRQHLGGAPAKNKKKQRL